MQPKLASPPLPPFVCVEHAKGRKYLVNLDQVATIEIKGPEHFVMQTVNGRPSCHPATRLGNSYSTTLVQRSSRPKRPAKSEFPSRRSSCSRHNRCQPLLPRGTPIAGVGWSISVRDF